VQINNLSLFQFKNHKELKIDFSSDITCLYGNNGVGKTNVLDAIYMLSTCKSYFNSFDFQLIFHGENKCSINGQFIHDNQYDIQLTIEQNKKKKIKKNDKYYDKLLDHIGLINSVMITPDDIELINGHSDERRKFIDITISQCDRTYLTNLSEYNKILDQRNKQLKLFAFHKHFDADLLESFSQKLIPLANYIHQCRIDFLQIMNHYFLTYYHQLCNDKEIVNFKYISDLNEKQFEEILKDNINKDLAAERTIQGIHKDDLEFEINGYAVKKFGSQGQSKLFTIALKLAQYQLLKNKINSLPILLLDDLFEKIDEERAQLLINLISSAEFGQIIITDTHEERVKKHFENVKKTISFVEL